MQHRIIAALDMPSSDKALALARALIPVVQWFKVGSELFTAAGPDVIRQIRAAGGYVFLDLKFHDIPNTVAKAVASAVRLDVEMLTVHTSGGPAMLHAGQTAARQTAASLGHPHPPLLLGVTVLTSMDANELAAVGQPPNVGAQVERLASLAKQCGLRGLVCSPLEIAALRQLLGDEMVLVTPGIRTGAEPADDQRRTLTPRQAVDAGANWLVIGRPIYAAPDPLAAAREISRSFGVM